MNIIPGYWLHEHTCDTCATHEHVKWQNDGLTLCTECLVRKIKELDRRHTHKENEHAS